MKPEEMPNAFNTSKHGSSVRKEIFRTINENNYLLSISPQGLVWPKKYSGVKSFTYAISQNQILIRDENNLIARKIRFAEITNIELSKNLNRLTVIKIIAAEENKNPP